MIFEKPVIESLVTESDVEQKLLYPLLVGEMPSGFGYDPSWVNTKLNIRRFSIGKGSDEKSYFPDYIVSRSGIPLLVAEAKVPGADLTQAFREARLYAAELNAQYPSGLQPLKKVVATDGRYLHAGDYDHVKPRFELAFSDLDIHSTSFSALAKFVDRAALERALLTLLPRVRPRRYWKPRKLVGGASVQREEVGMNSFGATVSAEFSHIFNPLTLSERSFIAKNAYISSKRRERFVQPIDRVIRASTPLAESRSKTIVDTAVPVEIIKTLRGARELEHQVLLIVGSAGAGKTTFVDYLREKALPGDLRAKTVWVHINMNPAPISRKEIYDWLREEIVEACKATMPLTDFDELDTIKAVHSGVVTSFRKGVGRLYATDKVSYDLKHAERLEAVLENKHEMALAHADYVSTNRSKLLIIVLDNCDKRLRDEQLLMFEAAQWIQKEFSALVVLPIREETYDNHHNEPPLDTALKDLVFRIEPPLFQKILQSRIQLAMRAAVSSGSKTLRYELPNGMHVDYLASDQGHYLSSILRSVFEHDMHVRRLIVGLAGRNMRRAMEIFLQFCTSGHISEDHIVKMVQSEGQYVLPLSLVTTVLLRANMRFYDSDVAYLKNIYAASERDERPSFFARLMILRWLSERTNVFGPKRLKGYVRISEMQTELARFGVEGEVFLREIESLARGYCVMSEDFRTNGLTEEDLVSIAPAGRVHLQIAGDVYYLSAVAEDFWFSVEASAAAVAHRIKDSTQHFTARTTLYNAKDLLSALMKHYNREADAYAAIFSNNRFSALATMQQAQHEVAEFERTLVSGPWASAPTKCPPGSTHEGRVVHVTRFGVFVDLEPGVTGLLHSSGLKGRVPINVNERVKVIVLDLDYVAHRMGLKLANGITSVAER